jgi:hypothetical protein
MGDLPLSASPSPSPSPSSLSTLFNFNNFVSFFEFELPWENFCLVPLLQSGSRRVDLHPMKLENG